MKEKKNKLEVIYKSLLLFFIIFSIHLRGMPEIISIRILSMGLIIIMGCYKKYTKKQLCLYKNDLKWIFFNIIQCLYILILNIIYYIYNDGESALNSTFNFLCFIAILPVFLEEIFEDEIEFCACMTYATVIQSLIVILSSLNGNIRYFLENIQTFDASRYTYRIIGLGIAGAGGSIYLFAGAIAAIYLILFTKTKIQSWIYLLIITVAIALVGRTGFYAMCAVFTFLIIEKAKLITEKKLLKTLKIAMVFLMFGSSCYFIFFKSSANDSNMFTYTYDRLFEITNFEDNTLTSLTKQVEFVPNLSIQTLIGTGISRGESINGLVFNHDSGYIKRYASNGLIFAVITYIVFAIYFLKIIKYLPKAKKRYLYFLLLILYIIEYKEPFFFMLSYPFVLIVIGKLSCKNENYEQIKFH